MGDRRDAKKRHIAECFTRLVVEASNPRTRVSVTEIVNTLGIERRTFYNHFENTTDLVIWIFRRELADMLAGGEFADAELVYPADDSDDKYRDLPFYARITDAQGNIDESRYFQALCKMLNERHEYYRRILTFPCYLDLYSYMIDLHIPAFLDDIMSMVGPDRSLPPELAEFLAEYHTIGVYGRLPYHFSSKKRELPMENLNPFWNYGHMSLKATIEALFAAEGKLDKTSTHGLDEAAPAQWRNDEALVGMIETLRKQL